MEVTPDGRLLVRAPNRMARARIDAFVTAHAAWIEKHLELQRRRAARRPPAPTAEDVEALKARARAELPEIIAQWSERMGVAPAGFKVTTARKRYGSCSAKDRLCFSCFLMNCPAPAVELVVVHELCHIREKNHGPRFYALLERYLPDWRERKKLLTMS